MSLFVNFDAREELELAFSKLSSDGTVMMPPDDYGFSKVFAWIAVPCGVPQPEHFSIEEVSVPDLESGKLLIETAYWSVDPAMRGWVNDVPNYLPPVDIGAPMRSSAVGTVIASEHPDYTTGETVTGMLGWQRYSISDGGNIDRKVTKTDLYPSLAPGVISVNGVTVYFGLLDICDPQPGETVVVSTAAGAVGSAVGEIAKIQVCRTVASPAVARR